METELSPTAYVVLGMLGLGAKTGYDIKGIVDRSTRFFWAASYGQIYPELRRLEEAGLVTGKQAPTGGRKRKAYELAPTGRRAAADAGAAGREPAQALLRRPAPARAGPRAAPHAAVRARGVSRLPARGRSA